MNEQDASLKRVHAHQNAELDKRAFSIILFFIFSTSSERLTRDNKTRLFSSYKPTQIYKV
jgi:hypothetical protein